MISRLLRYPVPYWAIGLAMLVLGGLAYGLTRTPAAPVVNACPATYTWTVHGVVEALPTPGVGRIVWQRGDQVFQHDFPTAKHIGDEVLLELTFDCQAAAGNPDVLPGCTCRRTGRREVTP